jgi:sterol carrier protein 2
MVSSDGILRPLQILTRIRYGAQPRDFAEIARINHEHSQRNPYSQFRDLYTLEQILESPKMLEPLTKLQCCPTSDGGAAAVIVSQAFLDARPELKPQAILIAGQCMGTDPDTTFNGQAVNLVGAGITRMIAKTALEEADCSINDIKVCELHDCFSVAEMVFIDALGLCEPGKAHEFVRQGKNTYGGQIVINPSGGLISKGHPLGATGLAQCAELVWHLRGWANNRLGGGTAMALAHNLGLGGAGVVTIYKRADGKINPRVDNEEVARLTGLGYNPAVEARGFTRAQAQKVRSQSQSSDWALADTHTKVEARF